MIDCRAGGKRAHRRPACCRAVTSSSPSPAESPVAMALRPAGKARHSASVWAGSSTAQTEPDRAELSLTAPHTHSTAANNMYELPQEPSSVGRGPLRWAAHLAGAATPSRWRRFAAMRSESCPHTALSKARCCAVKARRCAVKTRRCAVMKTRCVKTRCSAAKKLAH